MELIIVTGLSGSGKTCAMNTLEDMGYFCVDNLPCRHIPVFAKFLKELGKNDRVAVSTDMRAGLSADELKKSTELLSEISVAHRILYLDCSEDVLLLRYKQTRRIHPLMRGDIFTLSEAIAAEKKIFSQIKLIADYRIDTSELSYFECKSRIISLFCDDAQKQMRIYCMSFGFKHGIPKDADYVFDVRFLPNPFYIPELKEKTGLDREVRDFVMSKPEASEFESKLQSLINFTVPQCIKEGRSQLVIAVGCTGGHHRSVTFAERLCSYLKEKNYNVNVIHRDINK
ncbi:MAG: RNase adapter RapZ [Clostridia bacterium]|nr:RNase adapter RapZ [Clostridia bacterium]